MTAQIIQFPAMTFPALPVMERVSIAIRPAQLERLAAAARSFSEQAALLVVKVEAVVRATEAARASLGRLAERP